jgi:hypothetical protein
MMLRQPAHAGARPHVVDLAFWFFMLDCHLYPQAYIRLYESIGFKIVNRYIEYIKRSDTA